MTHTESLELELLNFNPGIHRRGAKDAEGAQRGVRDFLIERSCEDSLSADLLSPQDRPLAT